MMANDVKNLTMLNKSKKDICIGDIFALKPKDHDFFFGRVIRLDANAGFGKNAILIYIYNSTSKVKNKVPKLNKNNLLIAPTMLFSNFPWQDGYFETITNKELKKTDVLSVHCFKDVDTGEYVDDNKKKLKKAYPPLIGDYELTTYSGSIDY